MATISSADNGIGYEGYKALAKALTPNAEGVSNSSLRSLNLADNNDYDERGVQALVTALAPNEVGVFNRSLKWLNLDFTGIRREGSEALLLLLRPTSQGFVNMSLNTLILKNNSLMGYENQTALLEAARNHPNAGAIKIEF
ncbi:hypothetical protein CYMTET_20425 [Cymbomonas tetramitiformis]|uniref:Uncharacterized protein n=1 Tax=Cymbomonas tetramitiformis TaxID=36881 RepID=A0AAE0G428_9CHLO|nr:hypothetical protein CYMTET_20425 [Cymbomonas tetramitiformis]